MQTLKICRSTTNEHNNLKIGHYEPNIKVSNFAKYYLYTLLLATTMIFRNHFNNYYNIIIINKILEVFTEHPGSA